MMFQLNINEAVIFHQAYIILKNDLRLDIRKITLKGINSRC